MIITLMRNYIIKTRKLYALLCFNKQLYTKVFHNSITQTFHP